MSNSSEAKMINTIKEEKGEGKSSGAGKGTKGRETMGDKLITYITNDYAQNCPF